MEYNADKENASTMGDNTNLTTSIVADINSQVNMPDVLKDIVQKMSERYINIPRQIVTAMLLSKVALMATAIGVRLQEITKISIPNLFCNMFASSGCGKDYANNELDRIFFNAFYEWSKTQSNEYMEKERELIEEEAKEKCSKPEKQEEYVREQMRYVRRHNPVINDGTQEGLYADAFVIYKMGKGAILYQIAELGAYLNSATTDRKNLFNCLFEAYDGKVISKSTKSEQRGETLTNIPINCMLYGDFNMFKDSKLNKEYQNFLHTGLARRCIFVFCKQEQLQEDKLSLQKKEELEQGIKSAGEKLMKIFHNTVNKYGSADKIIYRYAEGALELLKEYTNGRIRLYNETENEIQKLEIKSRELKVIKLACLFAWINHYDYMEITEDDVLQAINVVEYFSSGLKQFLLYKVKRPDKYEEVFQFLKENTDNAYTKTELIKICATQFDFTRREVTNEFDELIKYIEETAYSCGYMLDENSINNKRGMIYCLKKKNAHPGLF